LLCWNRHHYPDNGGWQWIEGTFERPATERRATDFGEFAWLTAFDEEDQLAFRREQPAERCIKEWRTTARALSNEKSRRILTGAGDDDAAFEEVARPE